MRILLLGANGRVGSQVAKTLVARGHEVLAGIHKNQQNIPKTAKIIQINVTDSRALAKALQDVDVVVCALSSWKSAEKNVLSTAMTALIPAMQQAGVQRIISISGDVALLPGEKPSLFVKLVRKLVFGAAKKVIKDSESHLHQLYSSNLQWTVLRPTPMTSSATSNYQLHSSHPLSLFVSRASVVNAIADLAEQEQHVREAPFITSRQS